MLTYLLAWVIPESLDFNGANDINSDSPSFDDTDEERPLLWPVTQPSETPVNASPTKRPWFVQVLDLLRSPGLRICLMLFFLTPFALLAKSFVYQYASESFDWPMSRTTWLRVSQAAGASLVTIIFLPLLNAFLHKRGVHAQTIDLNVIRASLFVAAVGFAMLWQANVSWLLILALFVCGLSEGLQPSNQGLATSFIKREYNARMFTTVAVLETVGKLVGGPLQSKLFSIGRDDRHDSFGINFLASSIVFALLLLIFVLFVRVKR
ncbi:MAG: hypothetical protein LQ342_001560 [Letrouitia transgressa]|nr:MAG: hypothetical protein LQ342_001560 [Letrouitia transgressa]